MEPDAAASGASPDPAPAGSAPLSARGLAAGWRPLVQDFLDGPEGRRLQAGLDAERAQGLRVFPPDPLAALRETPPESVRVVLLGQDPYHGAGQAEGLAFSVAPGQPHPPSLRNLFAERARDLGLPVPRSGSLRAWAQDGVLLLNTTLSVREGAPGSHARLGWEPLSERVLRVLAADPAPKVFLLWGVHAQRWDPLLAEAGPGHRRLWANHPSPLAARRPPRPFLGCGHFGEAARWLAAAGRPWPDAWALPGPAALHGQRVVL